MVKIIGYYVEFKGRPDTRRPSIKISVSAGVQALQAWANQEPMLFLDGEGFSFSGIDAIRKIKAHGLDLQRALDAGTEVVTDEQLQEIFKSKPRGPLYPPIGIGQRPQLQ